jgi:aspartate aminotransferase-like enzyme
MEETMEKSVQLRIPGPTPIPQEILNTLSRQMINHRGPEFAEIIKRITELLKEMFQTKGDIFLLTCSGTGGMEAAIVNTLSPGDRVLSASNGAFGDRFADIAEMFGARVERLTFEWGTAVDPEEVRKSLSNNPDVKAVLVTHNETSTGVTNDLGAIAGVVKGAGKLLLVDAISSMSSVDIPVDEWGCDIVLSGSQKGWMVPPGLVFASVSAAAWKAYETAKMPRFYWDLGKSREYRKKWENPWTPALSIVFALNTALDIMNKEGIPNIFARHARLGKATRDGVKALGLSLFADEKYASNTVTAVKAPEGFNGNDLRKVIKSKYGVEMAGGQQSLDGKIFRIGHLGYVSDEDIKEVLAALKAGLQEIGFKK